MEGQKQPRTDSPRAAYHHHACGTGRLGQYTLGGTSDAARVDDVLLS